MMAQPFFDDQIVPRSRSSGSAATEGFIRRIRSSLRRATARQGLAPILTEQEFEPTKHTKYAKVLPELSSGVTRRIRWIGRSAGRC